MAQLSRENFSVLLTLLVLILGSVVKGDVQVSAEQTEPRVLGCPQDQSYYYKGTFPALTPVKVHCECIFLGDAKGQNGSTWSTSWYKNPICQKPSLADLAIAQGLRTLWEIKCSCEEVVDSDDPIFPNPCLISDIINEQTGSVTQTRCFIDKEMTPGSTCSSLEFADGTKLAVSTWCQIAGKYYWG